VGVLFQGGDATSSNIMLTDVFRNVDGVGTNLNGNTLFLNGVHSSFRLLGLPTLLFPSGQDGSKRGRML
jgi:hypothetical protein